MSDARWAAYEARRAVRAHSDAHARLLDELRLTPLRTWAERALLACLDQLRVSTVSEAWSISVEDAWTEQATAFCVVYSGPCAGPTPVGIRRTKADVSSTEQSGYRYVPGDFVDTGLHELGADRTNPDPVAFGQTVADFDIGEPLDAIADRLRYDRNNVGWWGTLEPTLPARDAKPT